MVQFYLRATAGYKIYFLLNMRYAIHWKLDQTICSSVWLKKLMLTINILIFSAWKCQMFKFVHCGTMLPWGNTLLKNKYIFNIYYIDYIVIYILHLHVLIYWERKNESNLKIHSKHKTCFENVHRLLYIYPQTYTSLDLFAAPHQHGRLLASLLTFHFQCCWHWCLK